MSHYRNGTELLHTDEGQPKLVERVRTLIAFSHREPEQYARLVDNCQQPYPDAAPHYRRGVLRFCAVALRESGRCPADGTPNRSTPVAEETYHLELKPGYDPFERQHGRPRDPIKRLRRLLNAAKDLGLVAKWGRTPPALQLAEPTEPPDVLARCADGPAAGRRLVLARAPLFLRVTFTEATLLWSGLDHLYHVPLPTDLVYVYRRTGDPRPAVLDWSEHGCRRGELVELATYAAVPELPDDETLRVSERWRDWCVSQVRPR